MTFTKNCTNRKFNTESTFINFMLVFGPSRSEMRKKKW